jgi:hypothetical protein
MRTIIKFVKVDAIVNFNFLKKMYFEAKYHLK